MNETTRDEIKDNPVEEPTRQTVHDPVCHMDVVGTETQGTSEYQGFTYYFCSIGCKEAFDADPEEVLRLERERDHGPDHLSPILLRDTDPTALGARAGRLSHPDLEAAELTEDAGRPREEEAYERSPSSAPATARSGPALSEAARSLESAVRERPALATLIAFLAGCLAGLVVGRAAFHD